MTVLYEGGGWSDGGGAAGGGFAYVLFECRKVRVEGDAAEVVDEGEVLGDVCRGPAAEEPVQNPLVSPCRGTATKHVNPYPQELS